MEVSPEEVSLDLGLKEPWPSPDLGLLSHKMGRKSEWLLPKGSSPSLLEFQWLECFPVDAQEPSLLGSFLKKSCYFIGLILARSELSHQYEKCLKNWICAHQLIVPVDTMSTGQEGLHRGLELDAS